MSCDRYPLEFKEETSHLSEADEAIGHFIFDAESRKIINVLVAFRKKRAEVFSAGYFSDPAWDILLDLADAEISGSALCVTQLGLDNSCPTATIIRHINKLLKDGFIIRRKDGYDCRRTFVMLSERGRSFLQKSATIQHKL